MIPRVACLLGLVWMTGLVDGALTGADADLEPLPAVRDFRPERYLGKWYEVARLPTPIQPAGTLATAEYSAGGTAGLVMVRNTSLDPSGKKLGDIEGRAVAVDGLPPGRFRVAFGPVLPEAPNYQVIHVDAGYRHAVVGVPDRKSLWILAREVPVDAAVLESLRQIARKAGFEVDRLWVAPWDAATGAKGGAAPGSDADGAAK